MKISHTDRKNSSVPRTASSLLCALLVASYCFAVTGPSYDPTGANYEGFTEPIRKIRVAASESGRIANVNVRRGDRVHKGDVLVTLDTSVLEASRRVAQTKASNNSRIEALRVEQQTKQERYEKIRGLLESGAGSTEETRRAEADAKVAELTVESAIEEQELNVLEVAQIEARIEQRRVRSPITGVAVDVLNETGEYVSLNEPHVVTVVQLDTLRCTFFVPTELAMRYAVDQGVDLIFPGSPPVVKTTRAVGRIEHVSAVTEADSGRVRMDVLINNEDNRFRSGVRCLLVAQ